MKENVMFYIRLCAAIPFFLSQVCTVGMIATFHLKTKLKKKNAHLSSALMVEVVCIIMWLYSASDFNKRIHGNSCWFYVWWKIIAFCGICMILSRCTGYFIVWCVTLIKKIKRRKSSC